MTRNEKTSKPIFSVEEMKFMRHMWANAYGVDAITNDEFYLLTKLMNRLEKYNEEN